MQLNNSLRFYYALCGAGWHFLFSTLITGTIGIVLFIYWFPSPLITITKGANLFLLIFITNVVCGPLLTLIVINPEKSQKKLRNDVFFILLIQISSFIYGIYVLNNSRPIALVYEVDRFRVVTLTDIDQTEINLVSNWINLWNFSPPPTIGIKKATSQSEIIESIKLSLTGIETSQRPSKWQNYSFNTTEVLKNSQAIENLKNKYPGQHNLIDKAIFNALPSTSSTETTNLNSLRWLPLISRHATDWVVLLDPNSARIRGYINLDGF